MFAGIEIFGYNLTGNNINVDDEIWNGGAPNTSSISGSIFAVSNYVYSNVGNSYDSISTNYNTTEIDKEVQAVQKAIESALDVITDEVIKNFEILF